VEVASLADPVEVALLAVAVEVASLGATVVAPVAEDSAADSVAITELEGKLDRGCYGDILAQSLL
jgi:hypothetical protein